MTSNLTNAIYPELAGKRVLITGAGKGIGRDCVREFLNQGCYIVAISRTQSDLDSLKQEFEKNNDRIEAYSVDIQDWDLVDKVFDGIAPVHYLVNNAGVVMANRFLETTKSEIDAMTDINYKAAYHIGQKVARKMVDNNIKGVIVNVSSQSAKRTHHFLSAYCCSKAAMDMLTQGMALELGAYGIRTVSVNPTVVLTELGKRAWADEEKAREMKSRIPLGRFAQVEEVTRVICFLMSDNASMISGSPFAIEGGFWTN